MMLVMAIDPNTNTGIAEGEPGGTPWLSLARFRCAETDTTEDIFERITEHFSERLKANSPDHVFIEASVPPSSLQGATNFNTTLITIGAYAIITGLVRCAGIPIHRAPINTWRKGAFGNGRMNGADAKRAALETCRRLRWPASDHNVAEAACIWIWGCGQLNSKLTGVWM
jgi:hypothetical protein